MPNIKSYEAPALGLRPSETGVESVAGAARRVGAFYNQEAGSLQQLGSETAQLGNDKARMFNSLGRNASSDIEAAGDVYLKYETHKEVSQGSAVASDMLVDLDNKWNEIKKTADPNDPSVRQKFMEEVVKPRLEKFQNGDDNGQTFTTEDSQKFAQGIVNKYYDHFNTKTSADMATMAGIAAHQNAQRTINSLSNAVYSDPSTLQTALDTLDHSTGHIASSSPTLDAETAARVKGELDLKGKEALIKSAALGAIQKSADPEKTAEEWIKKYPDQINGSEAKMFAGYARGQIRARNYDYEQNRRREKEIAQDKSTELTNQYLIDVRSKDPRISGDPTAVKILNDPNLTKTDKNNLLNYVDRTLKPETDSRLSQQTFVGLLRDLRAPNADPDAVMQKAWDARLMDPGKPGSMTEQDFNQFRQEVVARKTPEGAALERDRSLFFKQYAGAIAGTGYDPAMGSPKLYNAEADARRMESMLRSKGLDPHLAYDPSSEYFLGKPERMAKWQQSMQMDLRSYAEPTFNERFGNLPPASSPRNSGMFDQVTTKAEYDALPTGHKYIGKDGRLYEKR